MSDFPNPHKLYKVLHLSDYWEDSLVEKVYLSSDVIADMVDLYLDHENSSLDLTKEQGAFLLGDFQELTPSSYNISIEKLLSIESDVQSNTQIEFGHKAWSALDDALDSNPEYEVVGWFHTHPGHGIFLSNFDVNISETFFNKAFQIAMLIDPLEGQLNDHLSIGIFSFKKFGTINNY